MNIMNDIEKAIKDAGLENRLILDKDAGVLRDKSGGLNGKIIFNTLFDGEIKIYLEKISIQAEWKGNKFELSNSSQLKAGLSSLSNMSDEYQDMRKIWNFLGINGFKFEFC